MGPRQGLVLGRGQVLIRTPVPACRTRRLWARNQSRTAWLMCQPALSHTSRSAGLPRAASSSQHHGRNGVVRALTERPSTKRSQTSWLVGRNSP